MIKFENAIFPSSEQYKTIFNSMRNPLNSWDKSDSKCDNRLMLYK